MRPLTDANHIGASHHESQRRRVTRLSTTPSDDRENRAVQIAAVARAAVDMLLRDGLHGDALTRGAGCRAVSALVPQAVVAAGGNAVLRFDLASFATTCELVSEMITNASVEETSCEIS